MLVPMGLIDLVRALREGKSIRKCKVDGKPVVVLDGHMRADDKLSVVTLECTFQDSSGAKSTIKAKHPLSDEGNVIEIGGQQMQNADVDLTPVWKLAGVELKATLEYTVAGDPHEVELYARVARSL